MKDAVDRREEFRAARPDWPWAQILPPPDGAAEVRGEWVRLRDSAVVCNLASLAVAPRPEDYDVLEEPGRPDSGGWRSPRSSTTGPSRSSRTRTSRSGPPSPSP
ncbi:hypothetical protein G5V59_12805 [Nocardioides sp. W3-2-3]|uniref:hypothetical protein n=1 Tax=Nocardioides convexus TaxID=2712224 RepID=UPI002418A69F|nr:hypothetical protein [Nocardioides convexus]NHA00597.1 hypothetical protein [Nocardioides convexus]